MRQLEELAHRSRTKIERIIRDAATWWRKQHGRRIKAGAVKEAIRALKRGKLHPPEWLTRFVQERLLAFA